MSQVTLNNNVCDLNAIYVQGGYNYSVPKKTLNDWLHGVGFGRSIPYSEHEIAQINHDANQIYEKIMSQNPTKEKEVIITAGAPGSGKTTLLNQIKKQIESNLNQSLAITDPDEVSLKNMEMTYLAQVARAEEFPVGKQEDAKREAYNDWRPASNAIHHLILARLVKDGIKFCFGTTATGDKTYLGFKALKAEGYKIRLIHLTTPDKVRLDSIDEINKDFIHTTPEDIIAKAKLLPQRIQDTYLKYADTIEFYFRDGVYKDAELSAVWTRQDEGSTQGDLNIINATNYEKIKAWHNANLEGSDDLKWEDTVEVSSKSYQKAS